MPTLLMHTPEGIALRLDVAGAGSRFAASAIDALCVFLFFWTAWLSLELFSNVDPLGVTAFARGWLAMGFLLVFVAYHIAFQMAWNGRSPGKLALGLRVVSAEGHPATPLQIVLRGLVWVIDMLPVPMMLGVLSIALTERRQRLGDMVASTLVVRETRVSTAFEPWARESWSNLTQRVLDLSPGMAARFDAEDLALLRDVITRRGMNEMTRRSLHVRTAKHFLARLGVEPTSDVRTVLKELYLFLREHSTAPSGA